ncbi:uncharacterized protein K489DRAFT_47681 [Dissoconium aciculare CBS 342.82]|uniref:Uncharacterized protein n=1 Tax=Dissoconium aciculare CBS 342.82 TaxID=1314786 RepID=A0A6J3LWV8_9PEZI|nr:uncharacterized protein K489DRAFT_47681 [Dissoconium aciculare CBS 342.82]KAF1820138.1 hypothetical protein K489DRAFT_47681 [Dissoconium aciculare CBS 342.82]
MQWAARTPVTTARGGGHRQLAAWWCYCSACRFFHSQNPEGSSFDGARLKWWGLFLSPIRRGSFNAQVSHLVMMYSARPQVRNHDADFVILPSDDH